ncbi:cell division protein ZapA [Sphingomonas sp. So64.6b]|uniref:cell division protein ZapA n=1 Tax=Sphingomonas sp. So64.6b TaxID=2997354 RepID=UPI0016030613|nr:cell division protein ZapA [Sphingomonas sp. So64.6b]QNA84315.1 cell division protein ZapA [Sphingomonas sp. So64.6b]
MADVTLTIGDRRHIVACRDGEEDQLLRVGAMLDARWTAASRAAGGMNAERTMLFIALMLADSLDEAERRAPDKAGEALLEKLADRLEELAAALEN